MIKEMNRIDQQVRLGDVEIWEVSGESMRHPIHINGAHFDVLSRGGSKPDVLIKAHTTRCWSKNPSNSSFALINR